MNTKSLSRTDTYLRVGLIRRGSPYMEGVNDLIFVTNSGVFKVNSPTFNTNFGQVLTLCC